MNTVFQHSSVTLPLLPHRKAGPFVWGSYSPPSILQVFKHHSTATIHTGKPFPIHITSKLATKNKPFSAPNSPVHDLGMVLFAGLHWSLPCALVSTCAGPSVHCLLSEHTHGSADRDRICYPLVASDFLSTCWCLRWGIVPPARDMCFWPPHPQVSQALPHKPRYCTPCDAIPII